MRTRKIPAPHTSNANVSGTDRRVPSHLSSKRKSFGTLVVVVAMVAWVALVSITFDICAYPITKINDSIRLFATTAQTNIRTFDNRGIPVSNSARSGNSFISPYYVVHYGLIYSWAVPLRNRHSSLIWRKDPTFRYWDVPPVDHGEDYFRNCADWVANNVRMINGQMHLEYTFDWNYKHYAGGGLKAPWWSGLADGSAVILMLRAYETFGDAKYLHIAQQLYRSVTAPIAQGGSLEYLNGAPWIEEYVDPHNVGQQMSFVFNGMVYSTTAIDMYEQYTNAKSPFAPKLYKSIIANAHTFSLGNWSYYDAIGTVANVKYHIINTALLGEVIAITGTTAMNDVYRQWTEGERHAGYYWLSTGELNISKIQFILEYLLLTMLGMLALYLATGIIRAK